jgi:hypothetical protein
MVLLATAHPAVARRVVLTRAQLEAAAVTRLSDAMQLIDAWSPASNDGYTWMPTPRALTQPRATTWSVVLNGQLLDVTVFDGTHLELVPVSIAEVDSIVFVDEVDQAAAGAAWESSNARIEIHAAHATPGWTVGATASGGNPIGDPGPYRYTPLATPNVDAIGADASVWLARGDHNWYASVSGAMMQSPFTDPAMREQTTEALATLRPGASVPSSSPPVSWFWEPTYPAVLRVSSSVRAGIRAGGGWHEAIAAIADARRYFHYSEPFGSEVPTDQRMLLGGVTGSLAAGTRTRVGYRALASSVELTDQYHALAFDYEWTSRRLAGGVDLAHDFGRTSAGVFAGIENRSVETVDTLSIDDDTFVRAGVRVERGLGRSSGAELEVATTSDGDDGPPSLHASMGGAARRHAARAVRRSVRSRKTTTWVVGGANGPLAGRSYSVDGRRSRARVVDAGVVVERHVLGVWSDAFLDAMLARPRRTGQTGNGRRRGAPVSRAGTQSGAPSRGPTSWSSTPDPAFGRLVDDAAAR